MKKNQDRITIVGCGLSGMLTALKFASFGIQTIIIERKNINSEEFLNDIRTTALTDSSKSFLEDIGAWDNLLEYIGPINDIFVVDNKSEDMIHFVSSLASKGEKMGYLIANKDFKRILLEAVQNNDLIDLQDNINYQVVSNDEKQVTLKLNDKQDHECDLLIVCDGKNSDICTRYFNKKINKQYNQHALTFLVKHEKEHLGTAVEHFIPSGPFAILPLKDQNTSSIVWTINSSMSHALLNGPKDQFLYLVKENFGEFLGEIAIQGQIAAFPLGAHHMRSYFNNRMVVVADTAHTIHPLAGQGLNQGIKDIDALAISILEAAELNNSNLLESALLSYEKKRSKDNLAMFAITDGFNKIFSNNSKVVSLGRKIGFKLIENTKPVKDFIVKYAMGRR